MNSIKSQEVNVNYEHKKLTAKWIFGVSADGGMTKQEVAKLLGVHPVNLTQICRRHNLIVLTLSYPQKKKLKELKVLSMQTTVAKYYPKETVDALVKIVGTQQAWAAYNQVLTALRDPVANVAMQKDAGRSDEDIKAYFTEGLASLRADLARQGEQTNKILAEVKDIKRSFLSEIKQKLKLTLDPNKVKADVDVHHQMDTVMGNMDCIDPQYHGMIIGIKSALSRHGALTSRQYGAVKKSYETVMNTVYKKG